MIKLIVLLLSVIMFSGAASAVDYRGFADFNCGILAQDEYHPYEDSSRLFCHMYGSLSTTHGVQFNRHIFVGAGVGVNMTGFRTDGNPGVNVFGDVRYDLNIANKWSPFFNLKIGYGVRTGRGECEVEYEDTGYSDSDHVAIKPFFINPSIGVRLRLSSKCGLNFGLGYIPMSLGKVVDEDGNNIDRNYTVKDKLKGALTLNVGVDF